MRQLLNKVVVFLYLLCFLICPVYAINDDTIPVTREVTNNGQMELIQNEVSVKDIDIDPLNTKKIKNSVVPDTKKESKKVAQLFLKTMFAVLLSAIILYTILVFVKKFYGSAFVNQEADEYENLDLATPQNKQEALRSFLNRVK